MTRDRLLWSIVFASAMGLAAYNARLFGDDLYLLEHYQIVLSAEGVLETLKILLLNLDLGSREYRLYGVSRVLHFGLSSVFGTAAWGYAVFMAASQSATALGVRRIALVLGGDRALANMLGLLCVCSPFATTNCFHYYSYVVLPYQLTAACVLVVLRGGPRWLAAVLGVLIALTGESHLALSGAAILAAAARRGGWRKAMLAAAVPLGAVAATIVAHRLVWQSYYPIVEAQRFPLAFPEPAFAWTLSRAFVVSLWPGVVEQVVPLVTYSYASLPLAATIALTSLALGGPRSSIAADTWRPAAGAVVLFLASLSVVFALGLFSGQVSPVLPRRYGYVPYTLAAMALIVAFWSARRWLTTWPARAACGCVVWLWFCLELVLWPSIHAEDGRVWEQVRSALPKGGSVVFAADWDTEATKHDYPYALGMLSYRGPNAPEIIESTLSAFWWEAQYAVVCAGAKFAAFKVIDQHDGTVKLIGNDHNGRPPRVVPVSEVVVISDVRSTPPRWWEPPRVSLVPLHADRSARSR